MLLLLDIIYCAFLRIYFPFQNILLDFVIDLLDFLRSSTFLLFFR